MSDQANTLREIMRQRSRDEEHSSSSASPVIRICGAMEGVGSTFLSEHLSACLARHGADLVIWDDGNLSDSEFTERHERLHETILVLKPGRMALTHVPRVLKALRRTGICRVQVIVNQVTAASEGTASFRELTELARKSTDVELRYLGHCVFDEKLSEPVMKRKILVNWDVRTGAVPCLEFLSKRIRSEVLGRFKEEPGEI